MDRPPGRDKPELGPADRWSRSAFLTFVRMVFVILFMTVTLLTIIRTPDNSLDQDIFEKWWVPLGASLVLAAGFLMADLLTPRKKISMLSGMMLGMLAGLLAAVALGFVIDLVAESWDLTKVPRVVGLAKVLVGIALCYLGITTVLQTQDDFRLVIPYVEFAKQMRGVRPLLLDTSSLIDSRIVEVAETGISQAPIVIPQFVIAELQRLADSADRLKRSRGRRGLDIVARLQRSALLDVSIDETPMPSKAVDHMLVDLARQLPAIIVTTDVGLRQVASIHGIFVLNLNDLANALKPHVIPGEQLVVQLLRRGEQRTQAVGFLADGTMVVAEDGLDHIGSEVAITVTSSLQTSAGRMIFGRIGADDGTRAEPLPEPANAPTEPAGQAAPEPAPEARMPERAPDEPSPRGPYPPRPPTRTNRARNPRR
ncbi:MAG: PIN/TRAM domain-containing protein [Phycisphaerales bacterium]|nr:PIN/TRAM domain-containing protein [Phycisphaerales bacterium]